MHDAHRDESLEVQPSKICYSRVVYKMLLEKGAVEFLPFSLAAHNLTIRPSGLFSGQNGGDCRGGIGGSWLVFALCRHLLGKFCTSSFFGGI